MVTAILCFALMSIMLVHRISPYSQDRDSFICITNVSLDMSVTLIIRQEEDQEQSHTGAQHREFCKMNGVETIVW